MRFWVKVKVSGFQFDIWIRRKHITKRSSGFGFITMDKYKSIVDQCEIGIKSLENILSAEEFSECIDYVLKHNEWLLGLEFAIDWIVEDDRKIDKKIFREFEKAYNLMDLSADSRLQDLKDQIIE